jgi:hydrogenase expression/formation protein HypC
MCLGIPGQITAIIDENHHLALVDVGGVKREVNITCIVNTCVGDWVLVHVGFAMNRIDEDEAQETLNLLTQLAELEAEFNHN